MLLGCCQAEAASLLTAATPDTSTTVVITNQPRLPSLSLADLENPLDGVEASEAGSVELNNANSGYYIPVSYTHLRAHETGRNLVCRLLLEKKK